MPKTSTISTENFFKLASKKIKLAVERKIILLKVAEKVAKEYTNSKVVNLNFICTHNSRRSQLGQVWAFYAAHHFKLNIHAFSGGTEVTAFYRGTVKTLQSVGFDFKVVDFSHQNPKYLISFNGSTDAILGFSKRFDNEANKGPFIAITTCNNADTLRGLRKLYYEKSSYYIGKPAHPWRCNNWLDEVPRAWPLCSKDH